MKNFFLLTLIFFLSEIFPYTNVASGEKLKISNYITLKKIDHKIFSEGILQYRIKAETGYLKELSADKFKLETVTIYWFDKNQIKLKLSAKYGSFNKKNGNIALHDNVNANIDNYHIQCNTIFYDNNNKKVNLKGNIKILSDQIKISAETGIVNIPMQTLRLNKNVRGVLNEN